YDMHSNKWVRRFLGQRIDRIMKHAALVIAGNTYLADRAHAAGTKRVEILPTVVDIDRYPLDTVHTGTGASKSEGCFTIGWIGSPITAHYLYSVQPVLEEVGKEVGACLMTIGAGPVNIKQIRVKDVAWSEKTESQFLNQIDVGIMPLPDTPWARGKCGYKLIQYMACGKPVIASAIGANIDIVNHEKNGFLVSSQKEWISALTRLSKDKQLRKKMGYHGRKKVEQHYCLQITAEKLLYLLESCA
ncbi:MAG: glycosyltransferase family 4 protein, partial [Desulfobacterales bacterium]|nr:glycosyltransferase family 4 protein [Desulfobacterales bacterium]